MSKSLIHESVKLHTPEGQPYKVVYLMQEDGVVGIYHYLLDEEMIKGFSHIRTFGNKHYQRRMIILKTETLSFILERLSTVSHLVKLTK